MSGRTHNLISGYLHELVQEPHRKFVASIHFTETPTTIAARAVPPASFVCRPLCLYRVVHAAASNLEARMVPVDEAKELYLGLDCDAGAETPECLPQRLWSPSCEDAWLPRDTLEASSGRTPNPNPPQERQFQPFRAQDRSRMPAAERRPPIWWSDEWRPDAGSGAWGLNVGEIPWAPGRNLPAWGLVMPAATYVSATRPLLQMCCSATDQGFGPALNPRVEPRTDCPDQRTNCPHVFYYSLWDDDNRRPLASVAALARGTTNKVTRGRTWLVNRGTRNCERLNTGD